jgi:hypothetical protein
MSFLTFEGIEKGHFKKGEVVRVMGERFVVVKVRDNGNLVLRRPTNWLAVATVTAFVGYIALQWLGFI